ncbi:MAG: alpha/beta fold hydrolase [Candidatus Hermodarchaeota archaeon]
MKNFTFTTNSGLKISGKYLIFPQKSENSLETDHNFIFIHAFPFDSDMYVHNFEDSKMIDTLNKISLVKGNLRIFLPDLPGFGKSELFSLKPLNLLPYVEIIKEMVNHFQIQKLILGGCSMGGYIALEYIRNYPELIEGLVLIDTKPDADDEDQMQNRLNTIKMLEKSSQNFYSNENPINITLKMLYKRDAQIKSFLTSLHSRVISEKTQRKKVKIANQILEIMKNQKVLAVIHALNGMAGRNDTFKVIESLKVNALILVGEKDTITPTEIAKRMENAISNATLTIIPSAGHLSNMENTHEFNQSLLNWFQLKF